MIADHMLELHQQSLLHREDVEKMSVSMIGSRSTLKRIVDQMESAMRYPSANYDLYRAYTSLFKYLCVYLYK